MADGGYIHLPEDEVCPWEVASGINDGYPYIADYPPPAAYSPANAPTIWVLDQSYDGYPYIRPNGLPGAINPDTAGSPWNLHPEINLGYPYIRAVEPVVPQPENPEIPDIRDPIMVYPPETRDFSMNGICTIRPITAVHELNYNQAGEITVTHPFDADGKWQSLVPNNIILAPLTWHGEKKPQAFRIYRRVKQMDSAGKKTITVYARHVFYDLMYSSLDNIQLTRSASATVKYLFENQKGYSAEQPNYFYHLASDAWYSRDDGVTMRNYDISLAASQKSVKYQDTNLANALIGDSSSVASTFGLELYVDNFYFSLYTHAQNVNPQIGNRMDNSFNIRYSFDMENVSEDVDYTNAFTHLFAYDNFGTVWGSSIAEESFGPYVRPKIIRFSYSDHLTGTAGTDRLGVDGERYWFANRDPATSYTAKYAPIDHDKSRDFLGQLDGREVGDTGTVTNTDIGIQSPGQRIIYKKTDLLTGIVLDIKLGNAPASITRMGAWSDSARSKPPSAVEKQIEALQSS